MFVLYIDPYFLGDPLFATGLARDLRARMDAGGGGFVIVHGTGEEGERAVEALGHEPKRSRGVLRLPDEETAAAVERAGRDLNRRIADQLNEEGVSAVRVIASDRGLIRRDGSVGKTAWVQELAGQRAVPVILAFTAGGHSAGLDMDPVELSARLADALDGAPVIALGSASRGSQGDFSGPSALSAPDPKALQRIEMLGSPLVVVPRSRLRQPGVPSGDGARSETG